jgi:hypothetical protein
LFRAIHGAAAKRGLSHDELRDICRERFSVESMSDLTLDQLQHLYQGFEGRFLGTRKPPLPKRGTARMTDSEMVSPAHIDTLARAFAMRGWGKRTQAQFIRRQLGGKEQILTTRDFQKVFRGVQAMNRRDRLAGA